MGAESQKPIEKVDFVKETFAKFGLSMNLYNPNAPTTTEPNALGNFSSIQTPDTLQLKTGGTKLRYLLDSIPDYGFLLDSKLNIPQAFFAE